MKLNINDNVILFRYEKSHDDLFEGCWPIKDGVSINAYLVKGSEKTALLDYTESGASLDQDLAAAGVRLEDIDILVLNHMEPDHTGALNDLFKRCPNIQVYATRLGATETQTLYSYNNVNVVNNGQELSLGDKTLVFYATPNIHWPDTMMTYLKEDGIIFSCDAFGAFGSYQSVYDSELTADEWFLLKRETERYYASIISSFSPYVQRGLKLIEGLEINMICPSHGIIWKKDPKYMLSWYGRLATYLEGPREKEVTILLSSMYGNTLSYVAELVQKAKQRGVIVHTVRVPDENNSFALEKAWRSEGLVIAAPTYERELFPSMAHTLDLLCRKAIKGRKSIYFGSSLWSGGGAKEYLSYAERMKLEVIDAIEFRGKGTQEDKERIEKAFDELLNQIS